MIRNLTIPVLLLSTVIFCYCTPSKSSVSSDPNNFIETPSGLKYKILKHGNGEAVKPGQEVLIHETMSYTNDSLLFDSRKLPAPIKVLIGGNQVIKGIDEGLVGMKKGELRKLIIPPVLSKRMGVQTFPHPDSTLLYEIELIDILKK